MNSTILFSVIVCVAVVFYTYLLFQGHIMRHFNLVDRRQFLSGEETYQKLNRIMDAGEVSLYAHDLMGEPRVSLSLEFKDKNGVSIANRFHTKSLDEAVNQAYDWSIKTGLMKE